MSVMYHNVSKETCNFLDKFDALSYPEKLSFLAVLFEQMENGQINSENSTDTDAVEDGGGNVFYPADALLPNGSGIGHNILEQLRTYESGADESGRN